ncbi:ECF transporter S component [Microbacterium elymi]|uniref:ECF transporter S component n=1 Tax=Microbacterium elymi TaxID=2909587 RepID=A0ABY5NHE5_9MICO|nr:MULTISPECIES: ECF transporter S component [Microbacterium]UUT34529.1 ECF transporter S component [Microbacterium elymi]
MHSAVSESAVTSASARRFRWRVVDIVVASVIGVAAGVIFWLWGQAWTPLSTGLSFLPGLDGLLAGGWLFAGVLGGLVIRKPGAALYTEIVASVVSMVVGTQWGPETFIWGVIEGLGAEIGFAILLYRNWRLLGALVAGAVAGLSTAILDTNFSSIAAYEFGPRAIYFVAAIVSGILLAGLVSWLIVRALAATGALDRFGAGREARSRESDDPDAA